MIARVFDRTLDLLSGRLFVPEPRDDADEVQWIRDVRKARRRHGAKTARNSGLYACPACELLSSRPPADEDGDERPIAGCPRCGAELHNRKPASLARTWAYLAAALILYIPANLLPVTDTETLFSDQSDTIFSGVVFFWTSGSYGLALLVLFASIVVPLAKLIVLSGLCLSVQRRTLRKPAQRTRLYRIVEFIGRWSMLDVFVVSILTSLVQVKGLAQIHAGPGIVAFGAVCILTILASQSFDPRLIWDAFDQASDDPDAEDD